MKLYRMAWRNIGRNSHRSLLSLTAMAVVSAILVFGFSVLEGIKAEMVYNAKTFTYGEIKINNPEFEKNQLLNPMHLNVPDGEEMARWAESRPETDCAVPRIVFGGLIERDGKRFQSQGWGVDFAREERFSRVSGMLTDGRLPANGQREAAMGAGLAKKLGIAVGDKFSVMSMTKNRSPNKITLTVVGLLDFPVASLSSLVFMTSLEKAQGFLQMDGAVIEVLAKAKKGTDVVALSKAWNGELAPRGLKAGNWMESSFVYSMIQYLNVIVNIVDAMFVLLGSAVVINTTMMVIFERRTEIGALGALGMRGGELVALFLFEALFLSGIGAVAGGILGAAVSAAYGHFGLDLSAFMRGVNLGFPAKLYPALSIRAVAGSLAMTIVLSGLASLLPSSMAARIQPVDALRN